MADWIKCTDMDGEPIFVNLEIAMSVYWQEHTRCSHVAYPGGDEDGLFIKEKPEAILTVREPLVRR